MAKKRFLCRIGVHRWKVELKCDPSVRVCKECGREQHWLPGCGGQETGCWLSGSGRRGG